MNERYDFHPLVAEWLKTQHYSYQHEFRMPEQGIADFVAQHPDGHILIVECKVGTATHFKKSLRQVLNYQRQIPGSVAGYAIPADLVSDDLIQRCKVRDILLILIEIPEAVKQAVLEYELHRAQMPELTPPANENFPRPELSNLLLGRDALLAYRDYVRRYQKKNGNSGL